MPSVKPGVSCLLALISFWASIADADATLTQDDFALPPPRESTTRPILVWATHYFVYPAPAAAQGIALRDKAGTVISVGISPGDWCLGAIEGTIQISSGASLTTFNFVGQTNLVQVDCAAILKRVNPIKNPWITSIGKSYFAAAKGKYGDGVKDYRLVPFRTIAVDQRVIPYGTVLFIPDARGAEIEVSPNLVIKHDGYFFAADTGGAIKGAHIDVFCGTSSANCFPTFIKSDRSKPVDTLIVNDPEIESKLAAIHKQ